jgi:hypothetical protein
MSSHPMNRSAPISAFSGQRDVLRHQFGQDLIFGLDLLLQVVDPFLLG